VLCVPPAMDHDLIVAVKHGYVENLQILLSNANTKVNAVDRKDFGYLHYAICQSVHPNPNKKIVVKSLIAAGIDVNMGPDDGKPLCCASREGDAELVQILIDAGADYLTCTIIPYLERQRRDGKSPIALTEYDKIMKILVIATTKTIGMAMAPLDLPAYVMFWILEFVEPNIKMYELSAINILQKIKDIRRSRA